MSRSSLRENFLNAFSNRAAMSADKAAFPFRRFESAGRPTPISAAAFVTDIFAGSTSVLIRIPGCGTSIGFVMSNSDQGSDGKPNDPITQILFKIVARHATQYKTTDCRGLTFNSFSQLVVYRGD